MSTLNKMFAVVLAVAALLITGCSAARPLHRSHASIRASLLKRTPLGTSKQQVERFVAKEGWRVSHDNAYLLPRAVKQGGGPPVPTNVQNVLMADFGGYFIFLGTREIYGLWGFDADGHLVDIWIYKERDTL
jgi:hypothetical protein